MTDDRSRKRPDASRARALERATVTSEPPARQPAQPPQPRPIPPLPPRAASLGGLRPAHGQNGRDDTTAAIPPNGAVSPSGSTQEARHRGWYWHWNTLITQYAPLLGLKGVGLLNSYTVWTDRREGSPHQGFAFPAQESEARFYGEGREELITLNKILVALDLIEIHKEMVVRQDERGRRWRVPHNFYRVKDPKDGLVLGLPAMLRLLDLAQRDRNVFRQIRHIFGPQFTAIDRTNLWHTLLPELRALPLWAELEARAARERRTPRKLTATTAATESDVSTRPPYRATSVADRDAEAAYAPLTSDRLGYNDDELETLSDESAVQHDDEARSDLDIALPGGNIAPSHPAIYAANGSAGDADSTRAEGPPLTFATDGDDEGSPDNEGMMMIEDALRPSVRPDDRMHYQSGETKEEPTDTTSTTSRARVREDQARSDTETLRMLRASPKKPDTQTSPRYPSPPPTPARPAVSDLFAALAEQRSISSPDADYSPPDDALWDAADTALVSADDDAPLTDADAALAQPLPPEPGEGTIVVRAVEVTDGRAVGADDRALIADIEAALTMTNGRPPSDMEMSLYWQIARDCDAAARSQPGPGSGFGWVLAAITEAVNSSGTGRLAPKYVARICERWATDGYMTDGRITPAPDVPPPPPQWPLAPMPDAAIADPDAVAVTPPVPASSAPVVGPPPSEAEVARMWASVRRRLEGVLPADALGQRWFTGSRVAAVEGTSVRVEAPDAESARKLANYRGLISRRLSDVLGWSAEAVFEAAPPQPPSPVPPPSDSPASEPSAREPSAPDPALPTADTTQSEAPTPSPASDDVIPTPQMSTQVYSFPSPDEPAPLPDITAASAPASSRSRSGGVQSGNGSALSAAITDVDEGDAVDEAAPRVRMGSSPLRLISLRPRRQATAPATASPDAPTPVALTLVPSVPTFAVGSDGETNLDVWARALAHLQSRLNTATFQVWIEPTALIAQDADGTYVIGARNRVQRERLERQHTADLTTALAATLGDEAQDIRIRIAVIGGSD